MPSPGVQFTPELTISNPRRQANLQQHYGITTSPLSSETSYLGLWSQSAKSLTCAVLTAIPHSESLKHKLMIRNPLSSKFLPPSWDATAGNVKAPCPMKQEGELLILKPASVTTIAWLDPQCQAETTTRQGTVTAQLQRMVLCPQELRKVTVFLVLSIFHTHYFFVNKIMQHVKIRTCFCYKIVSLFLCLSSLQEKERA